MSDKTTLYSRFAAFLLCFTCVVFLGIRSFHESLAAHDRAQRERRLEYEQTVCADHGGPLMHKSVGCGFLCTNRVLICRDGTQVPE